MAQTRHKQAALPMHLTLAMLPWLALRSACALSSAEWKSHQHASAPGELGELWQKLLQNPELMHATEAEAKKRLTEFLQGIIRYQETPYQRGLQHYSCVMHRGSTRLLDCGGKSGNPVVVLVPSLINRYYILDLSQDLSFARYLMSQGFHVFIVDWGSPADTEYGFNCASYVSERLALMVETIRQQNTGHLTLAGYCMGGLLTLALAGARPELVDALACLATPWDFSVPEFPRTLLSGHDMLGLENYINATDMLPEEVVHTLFHLANPYAFQNKLRDFQRMQQGSKAMQDFLAIEHWVQDGVPLTRGVAYDCLVDWSQNNSTAKLQWRVCGRVVNPEMLAMPVFVAAPKGDRIVPSSCALPLAKLCRNVTFLEPPCGHVSMIVGNRRRQALWEPFALWAKQQAA